MQIVGFLMRRLNFNKDGSKSVLFSLCNVHAVPDKLICVLLQISLPLANNKLDTKCIKTDKPHKNIKSRINFPLDIPTVALWSTEHGI